MQLSLKNWNPNAIKQIAKASIGQRLEIVGILLTNNIKERISEPSPPVSAPRTEPHKDTGRLRASMSRNVDKEALIVQVGTNVKYGRWLELGTKKMAARPFLRPTIAENADTIKQIMGA